MYEGRTSALQVLCRDYLRKLRSVAARHGLLSFIDDTIRRNASSECVATEEEVELLSRCVDDERVSRMDIPKILGKSYRRSVEDGDFSRVKTLKRVGIYSKVSALLLKESAKDA